MYFTTKILRKVAAVHVKEICIMSMLYVNKAHPYKSRYIVLISRIDKEICNKFTLDLNLGNSDKESFVS